MRDARMQTLILRGYGPLIGVTIFFGAMTLLVPTVPQAQDPAAVDADPDGSHGSEPSAAEVNGPEADVSGPGGGGGDAEPEDSDGPHVAAEAGASADGDATHDSESPADGATDDDAPGGAATASEDVSECDDRDLQVSGDPYSPPCVAFEGSNPGETFRGVTEDEIIISARTPDEPGFADEFANLADADIADTQQDVRRTISALQEYFNERFEFYGRQLRFEFFDGQGSFLDEAQNRGHEQAQQDALVAADEIGAFAEMTGATEPFASALAQEEVLSVSGIHFPRPYHVEHRPLKWSTFTDCSSVVEAAAEWTVKRLYDRPADHAGDDAFHDRERHVMAVAPENPIYQRCRDDSEEVYEQYGEEGPDLINYTLDITTMSNQAANIVAQLQDRDATTVQAFVDPVMAIFLTARATEQGYYPEWIVSGAAHIDQDVVGQVQNEVQWENAFGISFAGESRPQQASLGYHAYKQVRDDEPAFSVDDIYRSMYLLAIGIQGAGPNLTHETFEQGMFDYPGGSGPFGTWSFGAEDYTSTQDLREIYWDWGATSTFNNQPGAWVETDDGQRLAPGEIPEGPPRLPR